MPRQISLLTPGKIVLATALIVPMMLIPTTGNARSAQSEWGFLDRGVQVKYTKTTTRSDRASLRQLFDGRAPRTKLRKTRKKSLARQRRGARFNRANRASRSNRASRRGYDRGYYEDDYASSCATPRQIHRRLLRQGWTDFHKLRIRPHALAFKARQRHQSEDSRELTYNLRIDRCSGALLKANLQFRDRWFIRWMRQLSARF